MGATIQAVSRHFAHNRILWSRVALVLTLFVAVFSAPPAYLDQWVRDVLELAGYVLLAAATLWRIWCLMFIGGSKDGQLAVQGPYSVVRNPLYIGSFIGIVGFGLAVGLPLLSAGLAVAFGTLYPAVVEQEERRLREIFGERFERYCERVPRWMPRWSLYDEPESIVVSTARVRHGMLDGMWYLWAFAFTELLGALHERGLVPYLF